MSELGSMRSCRRIGEANRVWGMTGAMVEPLEARALLSTGYALQAVARLQDVAPGTGGQRYTFDFEPNGINSRGDIVSTVDLASNGKGVGEGAFLVHNGRITNLAYPGQPAPGGRTFGGEVVFGTTLNDAGDAAFISSLSTPGTVPGGIDAGVYRYSAKTGTVQAVVVPFVTAAPGGGSFVGALYRPSLNNRGTLVFPGVVPATIGPGASFGVGTGLFTQDASGTLSKLVVPGDPAPGGGKFDYAVDPSINAQGDVAFGGHLLGETSIANGGAPLISEWEDVYLRSGSTGAIRAIAHRGQPVPTRAGGTAGVFDTEFAPSVNDAGDIAFSAIISNKLFTADPAQQGHPELDTSGVFLYTHGKLVDIARPGDPMPGGGHVVTTSPFVGWSVHLNNRGEIAFVAGLDTGQQGIFVWSNGSVRLVAKTGDHVPGGGVIKSFDEFGLGIPGSLVSSNDRGQIAFNVALESGGGGAILTATPKPISNGSIGGVVFDDRNANARRDTGEAGLTGEVVFLDSNGNGKLDGAEKSTRTDNKGRYRFAALPPDRYTVRVVLTGGRHQTKPGKNGPQLLNLLPGNQLTDNDFGLASAAV